jgi:hypothetical protein
MRGDEGGIGLRYEHRSRETIFTQHARGVIEIGLSGIHDEGNAASVIFATCCCRYPLVIDRTDLESDWLEPCSHGEGRSRGRGGRS